MCARNVFLCGANGRSVKVGGFGIADFAPPNEEIDCTRWTAQEALRSHYKHYASKCDVWSFGCTMWEVATLGKTVRGGEVLLACMAVVIGALASYSLIRSLALEGHSSMSVVQGQALGGKYF